VYQARVSALLITAETALKAITLYFAKSPAWFAPYCAATRVATRVALRTTIPGIFSLRSRYASDCTDSASAIIPNSRPPPRIAIVDGAYRSSR